MSKSQKMMEVVDEFEGVIELSCEMALNNPLDAEVWRKNIAHIKAKFQVIANRQDRLLEFVRAYLYELEYNDYVSREPLEIAEVKRLIAECEGGG